MLWNTKYEDLWHFIPRVSSSFIFIQKWRKTRGKSGVRFYVLVDQSSCLYDLSDSLSHFLKNSDCLKLSVISTAVNWILALEDFLSSSCLSGKVLYSGKNKAAFFILHYCARLSWKRGSTCPCVLGRSMKNRVTLLGKVFEKKYFHFFFSFKVSGLSYFVKREAANSCPGLRSLLQCLLRRPLGAEIRTKLRGASRCKRWGSCWHFPSFQSLQSRNHSDAPLILSTLLPSKRAFH